MDWWKTIIKAVFENRLVSRKSLLAIAFGVMIFYIGLPLKSIVDLVQRPATEELMCLPLEGQYEIAMALMALKIIVLGMLGWYAIKSQKDLDKLERRQSD